MDYKDIAVFVDPGLLAMSRVKAAAMLARAHRARLTCIDLSATVAFDGSWTTRDAALRERCDAAVSQCGLTARWRAVDTNAETSQDFLAHDADLLVASQPDAATSAVLPSGFPERLLTTAGIPMLLLPARWQAGTPLGRRPIIAWNATRESTRAVHDAMPILTKADSVSLFVFDEHYDPRAPLVTEFIDHLGQHGVQVKANGWLDNGSMDAVSALFACLDRADSDLIVAGAFGHAKLYERLFGGMTEGLLGQELLPMLLSH